MKKIISIVLAIAALAALAVTAFAAAEPEAAAAAAQEETTISAKLSEDAALAAALKDAGEKEANVTVTKNSLSEKTTTDDETIAVYTVKFETETTTWKYIIDANTGAILYKSIVFQSADVTFKSHSRSGSDEASGEMSGRADKASGEMDEDGTVITRSGRSGHKSAGTDADAVTEASLTDPADA